MMKKKRNFYPRKFYSIQNMSLFNPNIMQDESDLEHEIRDERIRTFMSKVAEVTHTIREAGKRAPANYVVVSKEMAETLKNLQ
jgi:ribosomal protein S16